MPRLLKNRRPAAFHATLLAVTALALMLPRPAAQAQGASAGSLLSTGASSTFSSSGSLSLANGTTTYVLANTHPGFFVGERSLNNGVYYMTLPNGNPFGYYAYLGNYTLSVVGAGGISGYLYHFDMGYEYTVDANDGRQGMYLYDFASRSWLYTSPSFPFPYLYDFSLNAVLYYYPDPSHPGHYNTNGVRYFYDFATRQIITK